MAGAKTWREVVRSFRKSEWQARRVGTTLAGADRLRNASTPSMGVNLWGESPLYENGTQIGRQYSKCHLLSEVRGEGNCGEATNRGEEACECAA